MEKQCKLSLIISVLFCCTILLFFIFSDFYYQNLDKEQNENFLKGNAFYRPFTNNMPWELNVVYNEINELSPSNNLILIGSSTTMEGVLPDQINLQKNWTLHNFALSGSKIHSYKTMINYINNYANHKPDKSDIIMVFIDCSSFGYWTSADDTQQLIESTGAYKVDSTGNITGELSYIQKTLSIKNYEMNDILFKRFQLQKPQDYILSLRKFSSLKNDANITNQTSNIKLTKYEQSWDAHTNNAKFPGNATTELKELILQLKKQTNVIIANNYIPSWQRNTQINKEYEKWVGSDLQPFLIKEQVQWIDFSSSNPDSEYGDFAHLFKDGRERYTKLFNKEINNLTLPQ